MKVNSVQSGIVAVCILLVCIIIIQGSGVAVMDKTQSLALRATSQQRRGRAHQAGTKEVLTHLQR